MGDVGMRDVEMQQRRGGGEEEERRRRRWGMSGCGTSRWGRIDLGCGCRDVPHLDMPHPDIRHLGIPHLDIPPLDIPHLDTARCGISHLDIPQLGVAFGGCWNSRGMNFGGGGSILMAVDRFWNIFVDFVGSRSSFMGIGGC